MLFYNQVIHQLSEYLVLGNKGKLNEAIATIEKERDSPSISDCRIYVSITSLELDRLVSAEGSLKLKTSDPANKIEGVIPSMGNFVRVFASDQAEDTCLILSVTYMHGSTLVLVPVTL